MQVLLYCLFLGRRCCCCCCPKPQPTDEMCQWHCCSQSHTHSLHLPCWWWCIERNHCLRVLISDEKNHHFLSSGQHFWIQVKLFLTKKCCSVDCIIAGQPPWGRHKSNKAVATLLRDYYLSRAYCQYASVGTQHTFARTETQLLLHTMYKLP